VKKLLISTAWLPPAEYYACLFSADEVFIEAHESYAKQTYRNRCVIAGPNGKQALTIPVLHKAESRIPIREVEIDYSSRWQAIHWRSIETAYNKSPFFEYYRGEFEPLFLSRRRFLFDLNLDGLELCLKLTGRSMIPAYTGHFRKVYEDIEDKRTQISPKNHHAVMAFPRYPQVFEQSNGFIPNLSIIDLLFNRGPDASAYLESVK
jgi:hypothetical protein